jgi:hypothetical protein
MRFIEFEICTAAGERVERQWPNVYINAKIITRVVKQPDQENVTYLDLGDGGVYVRGDFNDIAAMLSAPDARPVEVLWPNLEET